MENSHQTEIKARNFFTTEPEKINFPIFLSQLTFFSWLLITFGMRVKPNRTEKEIKMMEIMAVFFKFNLLITAIIVMIMSLFCRPLFHYLFCSQFQLFLFDASTKAKLSELT